MAYPSEWNYHFQMRDILESRLLSLPKLVSMAGLSVIFIQSFCFSNCTSDNVGFFHKYFPGGSLWIMYTRKLFFFFLPAVRKGCLHLDTAVRTGIHTIWRTETCPCGAVLPKAPVMRRACRGLGKQLGKRLTCEIARKSTDINHSSNSHNDSQMW